METQSLKQVIKNLAEKQPVYKNQKKTIHLVGDRILDPWKALILHQESRHKLRLLYATQGILRGRTLIEIESYNKPYNKPLSHYQNELDKLVKQYEKVVCDN